MNQSTVFLLLLSLLYFHNSHSQFSRTIQADLLTKNGTDSLDYKAFNTYLDSLLAAEKDTAAIIDTARHYKVIFTTSLSFGSCFIGMDQSWFADSARLVCLANPKKPLSFMATDSMNFNGLDFSYTYKAKTRLQESPGEYLKYISARRSSGPALTFPALSRNYVNFISFANGKYLIYHEMWTEPDIRGCTPPGQVVTHFLEVRSD